MAGFALILAFPLLLAVGFGSLYAVADALGRGRVRLDAASLFLYPLILAVPLCVTFAVAGREGTLTAAGVALPAVTGLTPGASIVLSVTAGLLTGAALFYNELFVSDALLRWASRSRGFKLALDGKTEEFAAQQRSLPTAVLFGV